MRNRPTKKYVQALSALYMDGVATPLPPKKKRAPRPPQCASEKYEQKAFVKWLRNNNIPHHHSPNEGRRGGKHINGKWVPLEGINLKAMGTSAGFPDIFIPIMRQGRGALFIEVKKLFGGALTENQIWWRDLLVSQGYAWFEGKGCEKCIKITQDYLS